MTEGSTYDEKKQKSWNMAFEHLCSYNAEFGHCNVPSNYLLQDGFNLGRWLVLQRMEFKNGRYPKQLQAKMEAVGVVWSPNGQAWDKGYIELKQFMQVNGHSRLGQKELSQNGYALGSWIETQRRSYEKGTLSLARIEILNALGFEWSIHATEWNKGLSRLNDYYREHGHGRVPAGYMTADGFALGIWVKNKRGKLGTKVLSRERIKQLMELGVVPLGPPKLSWHEGLEAMKEFIRQNGHSEVPQRYITQDGHALGRWLWNHYRFSRYPDYPAYKRVALEALGVALGSKMGVWRNAPRSA